ncbi:MAG: DUF1847 domain-containing protein [Bacteroidetes bacterium]|nr:DUF1847 domain-containing protein [Bacteroidota bacterium]
MNCIACKTKSCRGNISCGAEKFDLDINMDAYHKEDSQKIVQAAAILVDDGRAGTLSRIEELVEFARLMNYQRIGLAYCYGMESTASAVRDIFTANGLKTVGVSCTVGGFSQSEINENSTLTGVSCNPLNQAAQLNQEKVDLAVVIGLCLGHDILFNREFKSDITTLIVKDRPNEHAPFVGIRNYQKTQNEIANSTK